MAATAGLKSKLLTSGDDDDQGRITLLLLFSYMVAASGGLLFGYEHGISGVTLMDTFLRKFFPDIYTEMKQVYGKISNNCKFDSQKLTFFTSSLYIAGLFASFFASHATNRYGRCFSMRIGGAFFFAGAAVGGSELNPHMLILSRLLLDIGIGFTNQAVPLYLSEMALPRKLRELLKRANKLARKLRESNLRSRFVKSQSRKDLINPRFSHGFTKSG